MKKLLLFFTTVVLIFSCSNDEDNQANNNTELTGNWKLIEVYMDPGDGSGDFQAVNSEKTLTFLADGSISSNGNLCHMANTTNIASSGTYSLANGTITIPSCDDTTYSTSFEIIGTNVILSYSCIEGCREKYEKIE
jgi:hypothetical protein